MPRYNPGMAVTLLASQCPAVIAPSGFVDLVAANNTLGNLGAEVQETYAQGMDVEVPGKLNANVAAQELGVRYGGGANGVAYGLDLAAGVGLLVTVDDGHGIAAGGVVQRGGVDSVVVADNQRNYIWMDNAGGMHVDVAPTPAPADAAFYIGSVLVAAGAVVSVDTSGVVYLRGGMPYRETADFGPPSDTPPVMCLLTKTLDGVYLWDGASWSRMVAGLAHQTVDVALGQVETVPTGRQAVVYGPFDVEGDLYVFGDLIVLD